MSTTDAGHMPLLEHLIELRRRLISSFIGVTVMATVTWFAYPYVLPLLLQPLQVGHGTSEIESGLNFRTVLSPLTVRLSLSLWGGIIGASPWWLFQLWRFLAPALDKKPRRISALFIILSAIFFLAGAAGGWLVVPRALGLLIGEVPAGAQALFDVDSYLQFFMAVTLVLGLSALFPIIIVGVIATRILRVKTLLRKWRYAVLAAFTFAAVTNPLPDPWSMIIQALILVALYFMAVGVGALIEWIHRRRQKRQ